MSYNNQDWLDFFSLIWNPYYVMQEVCGVTQSFSTYRKVIISWNYHYSSHLGFNGASGATSQPWQTSNYISKLSEQKATQTTHTIHETHTTHTTKVQLVTHTTHTFNKWHTQHIQQRCSKWLLVSIYDKLPCHITTEHIHKRAWKYEKSE